MKRKTKLLAGAGFLALALGLPAVVIARATQQDAPETDPPAATEEAEADEAEDEPLGEFDPTEKVPADDAISFPVDI
jgi:hypothetical protein